MNLNITQNYKPNIQFKGLQNSLRHLPQQRIQARGTCIEETIDFISSNEFRQSKIDGNNWRDKNYLEKLKKLSQTPGFLKDRADMLIGAAHTSLAKAFTDIPTITIPWSGGRDSSSIFSSALSFFPEKKYYLLTVLNGMCSEFSNPKKQFNTISELFQRPQETAQHFFIDKKNDMQKHVIETALADKQELGSPAICSGCKVVMEKSLAQASKQLGSNTLAMGYAKYQGLQNWIEQTPQQITFLKRELRKSDVNVKSPFYNMLEFPFDVSLLLSSLGVPLKNHKLEMSCSGGGLNPENLDTKKLLAFLNKKNTSTQNLENPTLIQDLPQDRIRHYKGLIPDIKSLKANPDFLEGIFHE